MNGKKTTTFYHISQQLVNTRKLLKREMFWSPRFKGTEQTQNVWLFWWKHTLKGQWVDCFDENTLWKVSGLSAICKIQTRTDGMDRRCSTLVKTRISPYFLVLQFTVCVAAFGLEDIQGSMSAKCLPKSVRGKALFFLSCIILLLLWCLFGS